MRVSQLDMESDHASTETPQDGPRPAAAEPMRTAEQVQRWSELIADGYDAFPADLTPPDRDRLRAEVCRRRRQRLVQHIARAIALDLHGAALSE